MAQYLRAKKIDLSVADTFHAMLNEQDAMEDGIHEGDVISMSWGEQSVNVTVTLTSTEVEHGYIGIYSEVWERYQIMNDETVVVSTLEPTESIDIIRKKLLGKKLTEEEINKVMHDMGSRRIGPVETAFFMSTFFNPGFDEDETLWMTKGMAHSGDILEFNNFKGKDTLVVDKHSIGGLAGKAVTPVLVPIIASFDNLVIPNTSTRAITSPAGTSDILEVVMPVSLSKEEILETVKKTNGCLVWGGALDLAPADDVLINVEKVIHMESFQKVIISIIAKKISMGVTHIIIDIPYGRGTKVQNVEDMYTIRDGFTNLFDKVGIKSVILTREAFGPDGRGVGPNLEMKEVLRILERDEKRDSKLENLTLKMCGMLLKLAGISQTEKEGEALALSKLENLSALEKFWEIADVQGSQKRITSNDITIGEYSFDVISQVDGIVSIVNNKELMKICRVLGTPGIKDSGLYVHKLDGESVKKGDKLLTLYTSAIARIENAKKSIDINKIYTFK